MTTTKFKCKQCGNIGVNVGHNGSMFAFTCDRCGTGGTASSKNQILKYLDEVEVPDQIGGPAISHLESAASFWTDHIRPRVDEFYDVGRFLPTKFKMMLEPEKKSYILAEGMYQYLDSNGNGHTEPAQPQSKRLEDQEAMDIWKKLAEEYDLPPFANKAVIEGDTSADQVEVKVAITLQKSLKKAAGRSLTQAEKDMAQGQVINTTPPKKQDFYYVAVKRATTMYPAFEEFMGMYNQGTTTRVKQAWKFMSEEECHRAIQTHGGHSKWISKKVKL